METSSKRSGIIIADASALVSLTVASDVNHRVALAGTRDYEQAGGVLMIPGELFAETINLIGKKFGHQVAYRAGRFLRTTSVFVINPTTTDTHAQALELFQTVAAGVSYTDCLVMAAADHYGTKDVFGFDEIFHKRGYRALRPLNEAA
jgi:predicted nucleic acid-binding protein